MDADAIRKNLEDILSRCFMCKKQRNTEFAKSKENTCIGCKPPPNYPLIAPEGQVFICAACGKKSSKLLGDAGYDWDESCILNAVLCYLDGKVVDGY